MEETKVHLEIEHGQLVALRNRLSETERQKEKLEIAIKSVSALSISMDPNLEIDQTLLKHFEVLKDQGSKTRWKNIHSVTFMKNALQDDVEPCLRFGGEPKISYKKFLDAIMDQSGFIDEYVAPGSSSRILPTVCSTCALEPPSFKFRITDVDQNLFTLICKSCKIRLEAVISFYEFIRNLRQGLLNDRSTNDLYLESVHLRRVMFYARLGMAKDNLPSDNRKVE